MNKKQEEGSGGTASMEAEGRREDDIEGQMEALAGTFKQYSEQNRKLAELYQATQLRNQELRQTACRIGRDIAFLRDYCQTLEQELTLRGYYKLEQRDMLSRKETAEGIFLTYSQSQLLPPSDDPPSPASSRILIQRLQPLRVSTATQAGGEPEVWQQAYEWSQARAGQLEKEVRGLREANDRLEWQRQRRGAAAFVLDRSKLFGNIHTLIGEYKRKITALAQQKREVERKYKQLKEKVTRLDDTTDHKADHKIIDLYAEKIEVLQKLTERQQAEIENTIELYEVELAKIQERRREQIEAFQNERLDLETENLRLCIDLQKSLNGKDEAALQLMHEKNKNQKLLQEIIQLREAIDNFKRKQAQRKNLAIVSTTIALSLQTQSQSTHRLHSDSFSENSNSENFEYQCSQMSDKKELIERLEDVLIKRESSAKKSVRDKITITYGQPYLIKPYYQPTTPDQKLNPNPNPNPKPKMVPPHRPPNFAGGNVNKSYDSVLQYKKRFIERKPQSSFNL